LAEAVRVEPVVEKSQINNNVITPDEAIVSSANLGVKSQRISRKQKRIQRKMQRLERKLSKWTKKSKKFFGGATDNSKFRLGLLCLLGGLGFVILVNIIGIGWFFGLLGGLIAIAGISLMIWGIFEYTN